MKRKIAPVLFVPLLLLLVISYTFFNPPSAYGEPNLQATPTLSVMPWCCAFVVKSSVPFVWIRSTPSSSGSVVATVFRGVVLTTDLRAAETLYDGTQWWGYVNGITYSGWAEVNSLTYAPLINRPKMAPFATWAAGTHLHVRASVPFVWLRGYPSSGASPLYEIRTGGELVVLGNPVADNRQWWWPVRGTVYPGQVGWVEQTSLELTNLTLPTATRVIVPTVTPNVAGTPATPDVISIPATFQAFENGFMIWRADSGVIFVLINDGRFLSYWSDYFGRLPDNPVVMPVPPGRYRPIMGFGKVWGNIQDVEFGLGWAIAPERSYVALGHPIPPGYYGFTLLDGRQAILKPNSTWTLADGSLPPLGKISLPGSRQTQVPTTIVVPTATLTATASSTTISAAYQPFESGFMIWRGDNDEIYVLLNTGECIPTSAKGLPDNPVTDQPPAGRTKPVSGFGQVWGNNSTIRTALGWALGNEQGYNATLRMAPETGSHLPGALYFSMTLPDGRWISVAKQSWRFQ